MTADERRLRLKEQREKDPYHRFVNDNLILKKGFCEKKVGLFSRNRMFLLTDGPHLYYVYVDAANGKSELKGEVPFSPQMRTEAKNFTVFFIHTVGDCQCADRTVPVAAQPHLLPVRPRSQRRAVVRGDRRRAQLVLRRQDTEATVGGE